MFRARGNGLSFPRGKFFGKVRRGFVKLIPEHRQGLTQVAQNFQVGLNVFVDFGGIKFKVHNLGVRRKILDASRNAIAETHSDTKQQVAGLNRHVRAVGTVHAREAEVPVRVRVNAT